MNIADYQGWHRGHEALLLGNGPSLLHLGHVPDDIFVIGTNRSWLAVPTDDYHVIVDEEQLKYNGATMALHLLGGKLFSTVPIPGSVRMNMLHDLPGRVSWSRDLRAGVVVEKNGTGSVLYAALQLASWMGFSDIWIAGFDMKGPKFDGTPARAEGQDALFALTPPDVRAKVRVIEPTACTAFETVSWPWRKHGATAARPSVRAEI